MTIKVSVIIPVFNAENSIRRAIESCLQQTLDSMEIICVNDGSTDRTELILKEYEEQGLIVLVDQKNQGTGAARNAGIKAARGEFLFFIDSDDCIPNKNVLRTLYDEAKKNHVNICGGDAVIERNGELLACDRNHPTYGKFLCQEYGLCDYLDYQFFVGFTRFIYNKKMILENRIFFPAITEYEDPFFLVQAFFCARYFYSIDIPVYQIHRGDHIRTYNDDEKVKEAFIGIGEVLKFANEKQLSKLQVNILEDTYNTRFNIFMYPYMRDSKELIKQGKDIVRWIDYRMLQKEGKLELYKVYKENSIIHEVEMTIIEKEKFDNVLDNEEEIYIYGAGVIAERVIKYVEKKKIRVKGCIVTSMYGNPTVFHEIAVTTADCGTTTLSTMVIIALASTDGVAQSLANLGYQKIYALDFSKMRLLL